MTITLNGTTGINAPNLTIDSGGAISTTTLTVNSVATSSYTGFKNRIINPLMAIDQRNVGSSQTITAAAALAYTVDRWYAYCTGANVTGQRVAGAYTSSQYQYQFTGAASVTAIGFGQRIEAANCFDLANTTATLSCYISNSLLTTVTWTAYYANTTDTFGTLASPTRTQISTGTFTVSSTRAQYTTNISIPSAATTGIEIVFTVGAQTSGTWIIDTVQLEAGSSATSFETRSIGQELLLCQRYYQKSYPQTTAPGSATNPGYHWVYILLTTGSASDVGASSYYRATQRVASTVTFYSPSTGTSGKVSMTNSAGTGSDVNVVSTTIGDSNFAMHATIATSTNSQLRYHWTASAEL